MDDLHVSDLNLSDTLKRYFWDVFLCCKDENCAWASFSKTVDLIKSANVPEEVISQITDIICLDSNSTTLNEAQFFSLMKLTAAYLANITPSYSILTSNIDLALPRFTFTKLDKPSISPTIPDLIELRQDHLNEYTEHVDMVGSSTDSEVDSDTLSIVRNGSDEGVSSTASDSPTPTNSVQDKSWVVAGDWQGLVSEEQRQLLGTEEESSDRHSSEEDTEVSNEVWTINSEQREYYTNQFRSLQPDTNALLAGPVARMFFEKSRLPVHELRKIWQLADVTKDGALSLHEFYTAMHLVVLRRNHIELPDVLPPSLIPGGSETPLSVSPETEPILSPQTKENAKEWTKFIDSPTSSISSPGPKPVNFDFQKVTLDKDSKILHPVPLRLTPECNIATNNEDQIDSMVIDEHSPKKTTEVISQNIQIQRPQPKKINLPGPGAIPPPPNVQNNAVEEGPVSLPSLPPPKKEKPPPPPPRSFKTHGRSSSLDLNRLSKLGAPPLVPPRISPNIQQNSKKLINQRSEGDTTTSTQLDNPQEIGFANFDHFEKYENVPEGIFPGDLYEAERKKIFAQFQYQATNDNVTPNSENEAPRKHGAFEIYRKPNANNKSTSPVSLEDKARWELFQKLQEANTVLLRICQELSQELADVREEKLLLKVRLEKQTNGG